MFQYMFYYGNNKELVALMRVHAYKAWGECFETNLNSFHLLFSSKLAGHVAATDSFTAALAGYIVHDNLGHHFGGSPSDADLHLNRFVTHVLHSPSPWPLGSEWGGNFSSVVYDTNRQIITLCNDAIGWLPLYYASGEYGFIGGTNIYIIGKVIQTHVDLTGLVERLCWPYANYGKRTLLSGVSRLLPGEFVWMNVQGSVIERSFDNSFYQGIIRGDVREIASEVWRAQRKEVQDIVGFRDHINISLSGGWDSRLVVASIAEMGEKVSAWHYGSDGYEVQIARRVSELAGSQFELCPIQEKKFPTQESMLEVIRRTERVDYSEWFSVIDRLGKRNDELMLLGDHTESIVGRNIWRYHDQQSRMNVNFFLGRSLEFTQTTTANFKEWRENKINTMVQKILEKVDLLPEELRADINMTDLSAEVRFDLQESISRIEGHMPLFVELFDELFVWFHYNRYLVIGQNLHIGYDTEATSPNQSFRFLRMISQVHPELRVTRRLMDSIGTLPDLKLYGKIPAANIPWFGSNYPAVFRNAVWAARNRTDDYLMKRVLRTKDPSKRQYVVKNHNYLNEYLLPTTMPRVQSWYSGNWVNSKPFLKLVEQRQKMEAKPYFGVDLVAPANVSILLDLIFNTPG